ncbi:Tumor protein p63-regulated gene 1 protein [Apodemus speciosus]|uniref:Tumor protein p63-regulated gene 1 protein n=1 Tax=Apodemus speciosus TaxID=105296 RepID=A0ABQ0FLX5_APOSI
MSTIGSFEGFQPVSLKQEEEDQPSENDHLSTKEGNLGKDPGPRKISRQQSMTKATLYPNPYHQPYVSRKYFATRPGAIETAVEDLKGHIAQTSGETVQGFWLLTEIDHWNNEKEKILLLTDKTLLICKYDFIMLSCVQTQEVPLSAICRICLGKFVFPGMSLDNLSGFTSKLVPAIENAHKNSAGSGSGKELMVLTQPILIETYAGFMSFIGNRNKLGYSLARGSIGF